jgi:GDPmannose 4,6-dehydratase
VGTGVSHSVRELVTIAFEHAGLEWEEFVRIDAKLARPAEVEHLLADPRKAERRLDWKPTVAFEELVRMMVDHDIRRLRGQ